MNLEFVCVPSGFSLLRRHAILLGMAGLILCGSPGTGFAGSVAAFVHARAVTGANPEPEATLNYSTSQGETDTISGPSGEATVQFGPGAGAGSYSFFATAAIAPGNGSAGFYQANSQVYVNLYSGKIHLGSQGVHSAAANNSGELHDQVTFNNTTGTTQQISVIWTVFGQLSIDPNAGSATAGAAAHFNFQLDHGSVPDNSYVGNFGDFSCDLSQSGTNPQQRHNSMTFNPNESPTSISAPPSGFGGTATIVINLLPGQTTFNFDETMNSSADNSSADFMNTASLSFSLPTGVSFTSQSGVLLTSSQLLNISTRLRVLSNDQVGIAGFIIPGLVPRKVIIRGIGPSLSKFGISGLLADPTLELHEGNTTLVTNDNWKIRASDGSSQQSEVEATTIPPTNDLESAIVATLNPGTYTAILAGKNGTGVGVVEIYDLTQTENSYVANISTRGFVDSGDNVMIGGFIVGGGSSGGTATIIARAMGPSLSVPGNLHDPVLEIHDQNGNVIALNDDWQSDPNAAQVQATIPPGDPRESAIYMTLNAGSYTAVVHGKNGDTGVALVEVYKLTE